jgi:hypothetical protein
MRDRITKLIPYFALPVAIMGLASDNFAWVPMFLLALLSVRDLTRNGEWYLALVLMFSAGRVSFAFEDGQLTVDQLALLAVFPLASIILYLYRYCRPAGEKVKPA